MQPVLYHSPGLVVVQVGEVAQVPPSLTGIHELPSEHSPEVDVVAAAAPVPIRPAGPAPPVIAGARIDGAFGTRAGHGVRHTGAGHGKDERCFPAA